MARKKSRGNNPIFGGSRDSGGPPGDRSPPGIRHYQKIPNRARWFKLAGAFLSLFVIALFLIWISHIRSKPVPLFVCAITDYDAPVPPNAWAYEDSQQFISLAETQNKWFPFAPQKYITPTLWPKGKRDRVEKETFLRELTKWLEESFKQKKVGPSENKNGTLLIYLSAHGVSYSVDNGKSAEPALLLCRHKNSEHANESSDVFPAPDYEKLYVRELLELIQKERRDAKNEKRLVVLFLDSGRIDSHWPMGIIRNDFATSLEKLAKEKNILLENLVIFNAASPGERSWAFPEEGRSAFGHAVWNGLDGAADTNKNHKVTLREIENYVKNTVSTSAARYRFAQQQPMVFLGAGVDEKLPIAYVDTKTDLEKITGSRIDPKLASDPKTIHELWNDHEQMDPFPWPMDSKEKSLCDKSQQLLTFSAFESGLLRLEQLNESGAAYRDEVEHLLGKGGQNGRLHQLRDELTRSLPTQSVHSIALEPMTQDNIDKLIEILKDNINPTELDEKKQKDRKAELEELSYPQRARATWEWVLRPEYWKQSQRPSEKQLLDLIGSLRKEEKEVSPDKEISHPKKEYEYVEIRFLRLLSFDKYLATKDPNTIHSAIDCRSKAEEASALTQDFRTYDIVAPVLAEADKKRRIAEDKLFTGEATANEFKEPIHLYESAIRIESEVQKALALIDLTLYRAAAYAQWAQRLSTLSQPSGNSVAQSELTSIRKVIAASTDNIINLARDLEQKLQIHRQTARNHDENRAEFNGDAYIKTFEDAWQKKGQENEQKGGQQIADELRSAYVYLRNELQKYINSVEAQADDRYCAEAIRILLGTPLVDTQTRHRLRKALLNSKVGNKPERLQITEMTDVELAALVSPLIRQCANIPQDKTTDLVVLSQCLRQCLHHPEDTDRNKESESTSVEAPERLWEADRKLRPICSLLTFSEDTPTDQQFGNPFWVLVRYYKGHQILLHAQRALDDFYGDLDESSLTGPPYFLSIAKSYLDDLDKLAGKEDQKQWSKRIEELKRRCDERVEAASTWKQNLSLEEELLITPQSSFDRDLHLSVEGLPPGIAAISARDDKGDEIQFELDKKSIPVHRFVVPPPRSSELGERKLEESLRFQFPDSPPDPGFKEKWTISIFFRGHLKRGDLDVGVLKAEQTVTWVPPKSETILHIFGYHRDQDPGAVAFLLDCSESMKGEKIDVAREALRSLLDRMEDDHYRISLWLFGNKYKMAPDDGKTPWNDDVELVWQTADFFTPPTSGRSENNEKVFNILSSEPGIVPKGYTPLYSAIYKAVDEDLAHVKRGPRKLVVLSDGEDRVPPWLQVGPALYEAKNPSLAPSVVRTALDNTVRDGGRLDLFFLAPEEVINKEEVKKNIEGILGFKMIKIDYEKKRLGRELGLAVGMSMFNVFRITDSSDQKLNPLPIRLGTKYPLKGTTGKCRIELDSEYTDERIAAQFIVDGGESFDYEMKAKGESFQIVPVAILPETIDSVDYVENPDVVKSDPEDELKPREFRLIAHKPSTHPAVEFYVSIQNTNSQHFSPRPKEFWAEIYPVRDRNGKWERTRLNPFVFYDLNFDPNRSVPLLKLPTPQWPPDAFSAEIKLWFRTNGVTEQTNSENEKLEQRIGNKDGRIRLSDHEEIIYWVDVEPSGSDVKVVVTEQHEKPNLKETEPYLNKLKVEIDEPAAQITREYFPKHCLVRHQFIFKDVESITVRQYRLVITSAEDIKGKGAKLLEPLIVNFK